MEAKKKKKGPSTLQVMKCKPIPVPPGTKSSGQRLWRPGDPEPSVWRPRLLIGGAILAALAAGVAIGRFLLP